MNARRPWIARRDDAPRCIPKGDVQLHTSRFTASIDEFADDGRKLAARSSVNKIRLLDLYVGDGARERRFHIGIQQWQHREKSNSANNAGHGPSPILSIAHRSGVLSI